MEILDSDIEYAEKLLLPYGMHFDDERNFFIKYLDNCDLLAVPGSGKTTALQAKIVCLSRHLPLNNNKGILVLSHTNNAVTEIKKKLHTECYNLFEAPHFIGTVQDFVDTFLAIPYYEQFYKQKIHVIDDLAYEHEVIWYLKMHRAPTSVIALAYRKFKFEKLRVHHEKSGSIVITKGIDTPLNLPKLESWKERIEEIYKEIKDYIIRMKKDILKKGILHYDDCYFLADSYIQKTTFVIEMLRKRFKYIFIDETQDLKKYQLDLLDKIFLCDECCIQRIGDKNQTIFQCPDRKIDEQWKERNVIVLQNSMRMTDTIAKVVNSFTVDRAFDDTGIPKFVVVGKRTLDNGDIPPYLILFDGNSKEKLVEFFSNLIDTYNLRETEEGKRYGFHIIGWALRYEKSEKKDKYRLEEIFPNCQKDSYRGKSTYSSLCEFLIYGCKDESMAECKSVIIKILLCILNMLGKTDENKRSFTKTSMEKVYENKGDEENNLYKLFLYESSVLLYTNKKSDCYRLVTDYLKGHFSETFGISGEIINLSNFIGKSDKINSILSKKGEIQDIEISSVHSSKGQTHCATMYVETSYKGYESEHLFKVIRCAKKKQPVQYLPNPLFQEESQFPQLLSQATMRMMYVGFSRPTHLLCYAVFKKNWDNERIDKMKSLGWVIKDL